MGWLSKLFGCDEDKKKTNEKNDAWWIPTTGKPVDFNLKGDRITGIWRSQIPGLHGWCYTVEYQGE